MLVKWRSTRGRIENSMLPQKLDHLGRMYAHFQKHLTWYSWSNMKKCQLWRPWRSLEVKKRSNRDSLGYLMMPPKTRPLGEGVCKFSENSVLIYGVKLCQNVNYDVIWGHWRSNSIFFFFQQNVYLSIHLCFLLKVLYFIQAKIF